MTPTTGKFICYWTQQFIMHARVSWAYFSPWDGFRYLHVGLKIKQAQSWYFECFFILAMYMKEMEIFILITKDKETTNKK